MTGRSVLYSPKPSQLLQTKKLKCFWTTTSLNIAAIAFNASRATVGGGRKPELRYRFNAANASGGLEPFMAKHKQTVLF